jgi:hypothetical protein
MEHKDFTHQVSDPQLNTWILHTSTQKNPPMNDLTQEHRVLKTFIISGESKFINSSSLQLLKLHFFVDMAKQLG